MPVFAMHARLHFFNTGSRSVFKCAHGDCWGWILPGFQWLRSALSYLSLSKSERREQQLGQGKMRWLHLSNLSNSPSPSKNSLQISTNSIQFVNFFAKWLDAPRCPYLVAGRHRVSVFTPIPRRQRLPGRFGILHMFLYVYRYIIWINLGD